MLYTIRIYILLLFNYSLKRLNSNCRMMGSMYGVMRNNRDWLGENICTTQVLASRYIISVLIHTSNLTVKQGVSPSDASYFIGRSYLSMVQDAERDCQDPKRFDDLVEEQTPGGLNEQVSRYDCVVYVLYLCLAASNDCFYKYQALGNLEKQNVFDSYDKAMDALLSRLQGKSDGSI
jgi:pyrroline-5-carboxylate reductase